MVDDNEKDIDPFSYQAPIPKLLRYLIVFPAPIFLLALLTSALFRLSISRSAVLTLGILFLTFFAASMALKIADWLAWRLSADFVPGLRKKKLDEFVKKSAFWRASDFILRWIRHVTNAIFVITTVAFCGFILAALFLH